MAWVGLVGVGLTIVGSSLAFWEPTRPLAWLAVVGCVVWLGAAKALSDER